MEYRELGWTGLKVSAVSLGAWQFSESWGVLDYNLAKSIIEKAVNVGINFIDTAAVYGRGKSEEFVGRALKELGVKDKVLIATKLPGDFMNEYDVFKGTERSLKRLGVDVIDLMQVHWPPIWHNFPTCEYMRALERLVIMGKIRYIGLSDFPVELIESARQCLSVTDIVSIQIRYNLVERYAEKELIPYAEREGLAILAWSPIAKGALSGKYDSKTDLLARPQVIINRHPFQADHWFPSSIRGYICHLRGSRGGQRSPIYILLMWLPIPHPEEA